MKGTFCVRCGKESGDALVGGLCHACYLEAKTFSTLRPAVDLEVCVHCGSRKRGELWVSYGVPVEAAIREAVEEAVEVAKEAREVRIRTEMRAEDERNFACTVRVSGVSEGVPFDETRETRARVKGATCLRCSRLMGNYYEAIVQVRAHRRDLEKSELSAVRALASRMIDRIVSEGDANAFVLRDEVVHGGLDIYFGTTNSARMVAKAIASETGGLQKEHAKIAGKKDGNDIWRMTFAIRIPEYRVGDLVVPSSEAPPEVVAAVNPKTVTLKDPFTGKPRTIQREALENATILKREEAREAVVVSRSAGELQILDPWTFQTVSIVRPEGVADDATALHVVKHDGELVPVSPIAAP